MKETGEEKRRRILRAAEGLLATRSSHEVKLDEVADRAGIGKGTIYLHFKDKEDLFFEVAMSGFAELCSVVRQAAERDAGGDFHQRLLGVCQAVSAFFAKRRALFRVMQTGQHRCADLPAALRERWLDRRRKLVEAVAEVLASGQKEGRIRRDVPPEILSDFLLGMLRTRTRDVRDAPEEFQSEAFVVRLFWEGAADTKKRKAVRK